MLELLKECDRVRRCPKYMMLKQQKLCEPIIWERIKKNYKVNKVFANVPYTEEYSELRNAIIVILIEVGLIPILASQRSEGQPIRLCKICELMQTCKYIISDLTYDHLQNIPFELGFSLGIGRVGHSMILIDEKDKDNSDVRKFDSRLSNLKGAEVIVHEQDAERLVQELLQRIRDDIPEAKVPQNLKPLKMKIEEVRSKSIAKTLELGLMGWTAWSSSSIHAPRYEWIKREDTYHINGIDGIYEIRVNAKLPKRTSKCFELYLSGDTDAKQNAKVEKIVDEQKHGEVLKKEHINIEIPETHFIGRNLIHIRLNLARNLHNYYIRCNWKGAFSEQYLHVPWKSYYVVPGGYSVTIIANRGFSFAPKMYSKPNALKVVASLQAKQKPHGQTGIPFKRLNNKYYYEKENFSEDCLVVWRLR